MPHFGARRPRANDRVGIAAALKAGFDVIEQQEQVLMDRLMPFLIEQHNQGNASIRCGQDRRERGTDTNYM